MDGTSSAVTTRIIKIGNSQGICIPKLLIKQCGLHAEVELIIKGGCLVVRPAGQPRRGWADAFKQMAADGDDELLLSDFTNDWAETQWNW